MNLFERMNHAAPQVRAWIDRLIAEQLPNARPAAEAGFPRLRDYFPDAVLQETRVATVGRIPFLPFQELGLPEFGSAQELPVAGITYRNLCLLHTAMASESVCFHELVHAVQWAALGNQYLLTYGVGLLQLGYAKSPLEVSAFDLQSDFDRGLPIPDIIATIGAQARDAGAWAADIFRQQGVVFGAS